MCGVSLDRRHSNQYGGSDLERFLHGQPRTFANRAAPVVADDSYLRESILAPAQKIVSGYERGDVSMPSYTGVLTDSQIDAVILFIKSLK